MTQVETHELKLERILNAPPERVRQAFLDRDLIGQWFAPGPMTCQVHALDAKVGGQYEIAMKGQDDDGDPSTHTATGTYQEISDERIVMSFNWSEEPLPNDTTLTAEFHPHEDGTRLVFTHSGFPNREAVDMHTEGWEGCLAKLPDAL